MTPSFLFDFSLEKPSVSFIKTLSEQAPTPVPKHIDGNNRCPYPIPTVTEIDKLINAHSYRIGKSQLINDIFECGAIAISNKVDLRQVETREERYLQIIRKYQKSEQELIATVFSKIFALLSSVVYDNGRFGDYLGELFMRNNQGNSKAGQFFTPFHVSKLCAKMTLTEESVRPLIQQDKIITLNDPCCGSGGMLLASMDTLQNDYGVNYARNCFVDCGDIDIRCVHMTYLQLSLASVPAIIKHQDALCRKLWSVWYTPAYLFQYLRFRKYENLN